MIEDEPLIAVEIASVLEQEGAQVSGPVNDALRIIEDSSWTASWSTHLRGEPAGDIAAALTQKGVPFVFVTGYGREALPSSFARERVLKKPFTEAQLLKEATRPVEQPVTDPAL